jgi:PAS domain S-box-containing protein
MPNTIKNILLYSFPYESIIQFMAVGVAIITVIVLWKYGKSPEVKYLIITVILAAIWAFTSGLEFLADDLETKKFWSRLSYFGISFLPVSYFFFATTFSQKADIITPRLVSILLIIPFLTIPVAMTDEYHNLLWKNVTLNAETNFTIIEHNIWFWFFWSYSLALIFAGLFNLFQSIYKFTAYYKSQVGILLLATMLPLGGNLMYVTGLNPLPGFDWTPVMFVFTGLVITFGVIKYRMFDLVPFARNKLIDTMSDGVIVLNREGFIEDFNPAISQIFGVEMGSAVHKRFSSVFGQYQELVKAVNGDTSEIVELSAGKSNALKYYQARISSVYNKNHQLSGRLVQINDITSLKQTEHRLQTEVEERGKLIDDLDAFAHTVAHDLRSSLGSIYASTEIIEDCIRTGNNEMLNDFAEMIKVSAQKAMHITQELLILATVSHQKIESKPLDMMRILMEAKKQVKGLAEKTNTIITINEPFPSALGHAPWIEEIWVNYLTNAIKYGGSPPKISVGADLIRESVVRFWIKDNGNGISPENQHLLFQKYMRLEPDRAEGYGLGLSIVKRIIDKLGGEAGVESTGKKGEGALFWFELPVVKFNASFLLPKTEGVILAEEKV